MIRVRKKGSTGLLNSVENTGVAISTPRSKKDPGKKKKTANYFKLY